MSRQHAAIALLYIVLSIAMTWPLALEMDRAVSDPGDPYVNIWILDWGWHATVTDPLSLFQANAFHPSRYPLAYSEHLYGISLLLMPLRAAGVGPIAAYNVAMIVGFAFCGFAAHLLARHLTGSFAAALAAGVFYAFVPFRFVHLAHVQHVFGGWLPLLLLTLLVYAKTPSWRQALLFGAVFLANGLTNVHYLLFGALASALTALVLVPPRHYPKLAIATFGACVCLVPFLEPYRIVARLYGMERTLEEVSRYSAQWGDWLTSHAEPERRVAPGVIPLLLAALALLRLRHERRGVGIAFLWVVVGVAGSVGANFWFHELLFDFVPGFRAIRAPARWAVIAYVGMAVLIAIATAAIARRSRWLAALTPLLLIGVLWKAPIRWFLTDPEPAVYAWLAKQPSRGIVELPIDFLSGEYDAMLRATTHHLPFVNGVPGFDVPFKSAVSRLWWSSPVSDELIPKLAAAPVDLVIVHADRLGGRAAEVRAWLERELARGRITFVRSFDTRADGDWVFRIGGNAVADQADRPAELTAFLAGEERCGSATMGGLIEPGGGATLDGGIMFAGWAMSRSGIRSVDLLLEGGRVRLPAAIERGGRFSRRCADDPLVESVVFTRFEPKRLPHVRRDTDVEVEVTDGIGAKHRFGFRWFLWR